MQNKIKGCFFDLDGTLVDSLPGIHKAVVVSLEYLGKQPCSLKETKSFIGNGVDFLHGNNTHADNVKSQFGTSNDMAIYHDGTRNIIDSQSTQLRIETDALRLRSDSGETYLEADANGALKIYHNNALKFDTVSTGIRVHGDEGGTAQLQLLADQGCLLYTSPSPRD